MHVDPLGHGEVKQLVSQDPVLVLMSSRPLIYSCDHFLSHKQCDELRNVALSQRCHANKRYAAVNPVGDDPASQAAADVEHRIACLLGADRLVQEQDPERNVTPISIELGQLLCNGLHLDTNNNREARFATAIIYLNTVPEDSGGATSFPVALAHPSSKESVAAEELLGMGFQHTQQVAGATAESGDRAASVLLEAADQAHGVSIRPLKGKLVLFFTRCEDGMIDSSSWHGGEAVLPGTDESFAMGKVTLQIFKEIPDSLMGSSERMAEFVRKSRLCVCKYASPATKLRSHPNRDDCGSIRGAKAQRIQ